MSIQSRIEGLDVEQLQHLRDRIDERLKSIRDQGKVDVWVVSDDVLNLHWDDSYPRACQFLIERLELARDGGKQRTFELEKVREYKAELPGLLASYKEDSGRLDGVLASLAAGRQSCEQL